MPTFSLEDISITFFGILALSVDIRTIPSIFLKMFIISSVDRFLLLKLNSIFPSSLNTTIPIVVPGSIPTTFALIKFSYL